MSFKKCFTKKPGSKSSLRIRGARFDKDHELAAPAVIEERTVSGSSSL